MKKVITSGPDDLIVFIPDLCDRQEKKNRFQNLNVLALTSALWLKGLKPYSDMLHTHIYVCFLLDTVRLKTVEYSTSLTLGAEFPCSSLFFFNNHNPETVGNNFIRSSYVASLVNIYIFTH